MPRSLVVLGLVLAVLLVTACGGGGGGGSGSPSSLAAGGAAAGGSAGGGGGAGSGPGPFLVVSTDPPQGAQPAGASAIRVTFDRAVDAATVVLDPSNLARTTILVVEQAPGAAQASVFPGQVAIQGADVVFTPQSPFVAGNDYAVALTSGVDDTGGVALATGSAGGPLTLNIQNLVFQASFTIAAAAAGTTVAEIDVDTDRDGAVTSADQAGKASFTTGGGAVFYFNDDDDNHNGTEDFADATPAGTDALDLAPVIVRRSPGLASTATVTIGVTPVAARAAVRIFRNAGGSWTSVYAGGASFTLSAADLAAGDVQLGLEGRGRVSSAWTGDVTLTLTIADGGATLGTDAVRLQCAPLLLCDNTWTLEKCSVVDAGVGTSDTTVALQNALRTACGAIGATLQVANGLRYSDDRWIQDGHETGAVYLPGAGVARRRTDAVLQLGRFGDIDAWCKDTLFGADFGFIANFSRSTPAQADSPNYGGNLEVAPPYAGQPWGRIVTGGGSSALPGTSTRVTRRMDPDYLDFLGAARWQGPLLEISTEWLDVGHVDEIISFVPAPATTRGWVLAIASPALARQLLLGVQSAGGGALKVFAGRTVANPANQPYETTVNAILGNTAKMSFNSAVQTKIDANRTLLASALGLAANEIIDLPVLFENAGGSYAIAWNPGVVNLVPLTGTNRIELLVPDPEGPKNPTDPWQADVRAKLEALGTAQRPVHVTFVDVFNSYHALSGEAHCGTNYVRTPPARDWWDK